MNTPSFPILHRPYGQYAWRAYLKRGNLMNEPSLFGGARTAAMLMRGTLKANAPGDGAPGPSSNTAFSAKKNSATNPKLAARARSRTRTMTNKRKRPTQRKYTQKRQKKLTKGEVKQIRLAVAETKKVDLYLRGAGAISTGAMGTMLMSHVPAANAGTSPPNDSLGDSHSFPTLPTGTGDHERTGNEIMMKSLYGRVGIMLPPNRSAIPLSDGTLTLANAPLMYRILLVRWKGATNLANPAVGDGSVDAPLDGIAADADPTTRSIIFSHFNFRGDNVDILEDVTISPNQSDIVESQDASFRYVDFVGSMHTYEFNWTRHVKGKKVVYDDGIATFAGSGCDASQGQLGLYVIQCGATARPVKVYGQFRLTYADY